MHGRAKNNTNPLRPGLASIGNHPRCAAIKPAKTNAKNGNVTNKIFSTGLFCL